MSTVILDLKKKIELNLEKKGIVDIPPLRTRLSVDCSGSMDDEFRNGWVQKAVDLFIAAALKFDDNGELEMSFFNNDLHDDYPVATIEDGGAYMKTKAKRVRAYGGTSYAPIIEWLFDKETVVQEGSKAGFFGRLVGQRDVEAVKELHQGSELGYLGVITDGDNADPRQFETILRGTNNNVFIQFIAIGNQVRVDYLKRIAEQYPHVHFIHIKDPHSTTPDTFYEQLVNDKLATWIKGLK